MLLTEIVTYNAPPKDAAPPMMLMGIFSSATLLTVMFNQDGYAALDQFLMRAMQGFVGLTWACCLYGIVGILLKPKASDQVGC